MKKNADYSAAAHAANDKGGASASPSNPTRVGKHKTAYRFILLCFLATLVGCAGGPCVDVRGPNGIGFGIGGGGPRHPRHMAGMQQAPSLPQTAVMAIQRRAGGNISFIEQEIARAGYSATVTRRPDGGFHYHWHAVGGGNNHHNHGGEWYAEPPRYRPGCGIMFRDTTFAEPPPWRYEYADREDEFRHRRQIHKFPFSGEWQ